MQLFCINSANLFPLPLTCKQRKLSDLLTLALIINRLRAIYLTLSYIYLTLGYETIVASYETIVAVRKNPKRADFCPKPADFCPKRADFFGQCGLTILVDYLKPLWFYRQMF